jgi:hypothetical protein
LTQRFPASGHETLAGRLSPPAEARDQDTGEQDRERCREDHPALLRDGQLFFHFAGCVPEPPGDLARLLPRPGLDAGPGSEGRNGLADVFPGALDLLGQGLDAVRWS